MDKETLTTIIVAIFASSGFWAFLLGFVNKILDGKSAKNQMILGLGHDRIIFLCEKYIAQGWIYSEDFENLHDYLYIPYKKLKGNGTAEKLMHDVEKLPIRQKKGS
jgi:hypothetical protein